MPENNFADRLLGEIEKKGTPLVVGIDPVYENLPGVITKHREMNDDEDAEAAVDAILEFSTRLLKIVAPHIAAVKINSAFFEQYYSYGYEAFLAVEQEAAAHWLIVINDAKRGDIGNTSERYAMATLADPEFVNMAGMVAADAVTVNPYMGADSVGPFVKTAHDFDKGVFVLVRTSNAGAAEIQDQILQSGVPLYEHVGKLVEKWGAEMIGERGYSSIGRCGRCDECRAAHQVARKCFPKRFFSCQATVLKAVPHPMSPRRSPTARGDHQFLARDHLRAQGMRSTRGCRGKRPPRRRCSAPRKKLRRP